MNIEVGASRPFAWRVTRAAGGAPNTARRRVGCVALGLLLTGAAATARAHDIAVYTYHSDTRGRGGSRTKRC